MQILNILLIGLEVLALFNLLIFVHELGHFLFAKWRGLKVERFAIWFGKPIWTTTYNGVEFCLGWIPAGGYVSLPQMASMEVIEGKTDSHQEALPPVSALDKILVAFAGPLFSFGLALAFAVVVWMVGRPVSEAETTTTIGYVEKGGPADQAGLRPGDKILEVDNKPVTKFGGMGPSVTWRIVRSEGETIPVKLERQGKTLEIEVTPTKDPTKVWQRKSLRQIKILPAQSVLVFEVVTNSPAARAGLRPGDEVLAVNGQHLHHYAGVGGMIAENPGRPVTFQYRRGTQTAEVAMMPEIPAGTTNQRPMVGVVWDGNGRITLAHPGPVEQVVSSLDAMASTFGALFSRKSDIKPQHLGGAVKIMDILGRLFAAEDGWRLALWFSVLLNVNLALLNLLPIPVLDGGHILLALIEGLRRKPINMKIANAIQTGCAALLIGYMVYIAFYDVQELPWKREKEASPPVFAPKPQPAQ